MHARATPGMGNAVAFRADLIDERAYAWERAEVVVASGGRSDPVAEPVPGRLEGDVTVATTDAFACSTRRCGARWMVFIAPRQTIAAECSRIARRTVDRRTSPRSARTLPRAYRAI